MDADRSPEVQDGMHDLRTNQPAHGADRRGSTAAYRGSDRGEAKPVAQCKRCSGQGLAYSWLKRMPMTHDKNNGLYSSYALRLNVVFENKILLMSYVLPALDAIINNTAYLT